ncbi:predicted protein [Streptomyces viridochromogenes DSM 40736]|uniref:Predicted protein n=1 Tax=Streptomyces viridochromogenes (strain DSM 40736 / JCM 4977 / BCRC 1201 / Tue 494) TaxID=591159 RepID=D9WZD4_STRVT|nr:hypothetical protein [Streptomyces viridochromogenes]EFL35437.1 predicted protein [Streptomyces viridochromogenes DSM 40736]
MNPDASAAVSDPRLLIVPQVSQSYGHLSKECRATVAACPEIRSISHVVSNTVVFAVREADAVPFPTGMSWEDEADTEGRPGRRLVRWVLETDEAMRALDVGYLMRTLVVTPEGGMQCSRLHSAQYLVGISPSGPGCDAMDTTMNRLVTKIRTGRQMVDELPGGRPGEVKEPLVQGSSLFMHVLSRDAQEAQRLRGIWHRHLNPRDLHYAAYYRDWSLVCSGDAFEHQELEDSFAVVSVAARRAIYRDLVSRLREQLTDLAGIMAPVTRAPIRRLVLDVVDGAFYMHWLGDAAGDFVVGVTFRQPQVAVAEERLLDLIAEVRVPH